MSVQVVVRNFSVSLARRLLGLLSGKDQLVGCSDVATERVETPDEVAGSSLAR
jgi:hypothetical protein